MRKIANRSARGDNPIIGSEWAEEPPVIRRVLAAAIAAGMRVVRQGGRPVIVATRRRGTE